MARGPRSSELGQKTLRGLMKLGFSQGDLWGFPKLNLALSAFIYSLSTLPPFGNRRSRGDRDGQDCQDRAGEL